MDPVEFAQRQLDAYNDRNLERFAAEYAEDVLVFRPPQPEPVLKGKQALKDHYAKNRFNLPGLHAELLSRMTFGNKVIDHERVHGVSLEPLDGAAVYEVTDAGISKVWFFSAN
jgi:hypothetical protein